MRKLLQFLRNDRGATAVEYAVALALTVGAFAVTTAFMNQQAGITFQVVSGSVSTYGSETIVVPANATP